MKVDKQYDPLGCHKESSITFKQKPAFCHVTRQNTSSVTHRRFFSCTRTDPSGSPSWCLPGGFLLPETSAHPPPSFEGHLDLRTS